MEHAPGFLAVVDEARPRVHEVTVAEARELLDADPEARLVDVREDSEWTRGHAVEAAHLGKGVFERDVEAMFPDKSRALVFYCGGGYRSILVADVARRMGYVNVHSLAGGHKAMRAANWPMTPPSDEA